MKRRKYEAITQGSYYAWTKRSTLSRTMRQPTLQAEIIAMHKRTRETFGLERLQRALGAAGVETGVHSVKRIRKTLRLRCKQKKMFKATTNSRHNLPVAPNLPKQDFKADAPNRAWVTDLTYLSTNGETSGTNPEVSAADPG
jgi:putative transposase